jgi:alkylation response protein AidB-like acyl-CoA dehydrogenase
MVEPIIRFGQKEIQPHVMAWEESGAHPKELVKQFGALGYYANPHPLADGGAGVFFTYLVQSLIR